MKNDQLRTNFVGSLWKLLACLAFAVVNLIVRHISGGSGKSLIALPVTVVTFYEYLFASGVMIPFALYRARHNLADLKTKHPLKQFIRLSAAVLGVVSFYAALEAMPIGHAVALQFTGPIFSVIGAKLYLGERIGPYRALGVLIGISGAFFVTRPDLAFSKDAAEFLGWSVLLPLTSAILFAITKLIGRDLARRGESPELMALYLLVFMIPGSLVLALGQWRVPTSEEMSFLLVLGGVGLIAHYATAQAFKHAEVIYLMPIGFSRLVFSAILAYIFFEEYPKSSYALPGMVLILFSVLALAYGEKQKGATWRQMLRKYQR